MRDKSPDPRARVNIIYNIITYIVDAEARIYRCYVHPRHSIFSQLGIACESTRIVHALGAHNAARVLIINISLEF